MNLGKLAQEYFRDLLKDSTNYRVEWSQLSSNSVSVNIRSLYWFPPKYTLIDWIKEHLSEILDRLLSYLHEHFPKYIIQVESSILHGDNWTFVISYFPDLLLPKEVIQKIFGHLGAKEIRRLTSEDPQLRGLFDLGNPYFWYLLVVENYGTLYPQLYKLPMSLTSWEKLYDELEISNLTFDLEMFKTALKNENTEVMKMLLQDPNINFPSIGPHRIPEVIKRTVEKMKPQDTYRRFVFPSGHRRTVFVPEDLGQFLIKEPVVIGREGDFVVLSKDQLLHS